MKSLIYVCLLVMSAGTVAQAAKTETATAKREAGDATRDAEDAATRAKLDEARARLDKAAREVAELSTQLGDDVRRRNIMFIDGGRRAMLGVQIDPQSGSDGARVRSVSPGGPAAEAGIHEGDVIVSLNDVTISGTDHSGRVLIEHMREVRPEQKVKVRVLRAGKNKDVVVVARPFGRGEERMFNMAMPPMAGVTGPMPMMQGFATWPGEFGGMELASITPKLGAYFGATNGVLVVQAPENDSFKLEDGDVIQTIDGRKPDDGAHAMRILRSYQSGEKLNLGVLRQRKPLTLAITMPDRPDVFVHGTFEGGETAMAPPLPPMPPMPASTAHPGTPGTEQ